MKQDNLGQFIVKLRKKNNLTQAQLASHLGVTYQAISKWENGRSIPDIMILKKISEDFDVSIMELLNGKKKKKRINYKIFSFFIITIVIITLIITLIIKNVNHYEFKELHTDNNEFMINGVIAYSKEKSSIYISNITYRNEDNAEYKVLECKLYQQNNKTITEISKCGNLENELSNATTLNDLLKSVSFKVDDYSKYCNTIRTDNLYLEINAKNKDDKVVSYHIPLSQEGCK